MNTAVFGAAPVASKISFWSTKASPRIIRRGREIAEDELVALLGDRRRGGDVDDEGDALLLGDLGDGGGLAGVEGADQQLRAVADQLLGAGAGHLDVGFGVGVHDLQRRQPEILEEPGGDVDAALAVLADAGLRRRSAAAARRPSAARPARGRC